ncbi:lasso peptide biosynthesis B2 protein [Paenibacillus sacheonensis]|uniref:Lasso peptide biosynthesis B2 protein n=1 Tax=Paenibacillus sacheonensis TaxID=742054 RepID=A0A7X4YQU6_9BACL|nr:lasso peptide biosynthesis B2 protein [Paenibacillus sacheonensis]NBC69884.1 lasso peptide biosynthesis B2 protein [Paenibacillus sacheonensis]
MRLLLIEAFFYIGWASILKALPFRRIAPALGQQQVETSFGPNGARETELIKIARALHMVSRHTWWPSQCLVMAIAGMKMLGRRKIESTLYMGTAKGASGMKAHAWLRSGRLYLTGADEMKHYTVVAMFGKTFELEATQKEQVR